MLNEFGMNAIVITITQLVIETIVMTLYSLYCSPGNVYKYNINKRRFLDLYGPHICAIVCLLLDAEYL